MIEIRNLSVRFQSGVIAIDGFDLTVVQIMKFGADQAAPRFAVSFL